MAESASPLATACLLHALPSDLLETVLCLLSPADIVAAVGPTSYRLYQAAVSDDLWRRVLRSRYQVVLDHAFGGACPPLDPRLSWRTHYFEFRRSWMRPAKGDGDGDGRAIMSICDEAGRPHVFDVTDYVSAAEFEPAIMPHR